MRLDILKVFILAIMRGLFVYSIHWFQSVHGYFDSEGKNAKEERGPSGDDFSGTSAEKYSQTARLTSKRLELYRREFELLYYSVSSAKIFFR